MHRPFVGYRITKSRQFRKGLYIIIVEYWHLTKSIANREKEGERTTPVGKPANPLTQPLVGPPEWTGPLSQLWAHHLLSCPAVSP
jgi:hypothetical protein